MDTVQWNLIVSTCSTGFATTDQSFNGQDIAAVHIAFFLGGKEFLDFSVFVFDGFVGVFIKKLVETVDEVHETYYFFIAYGNVSGSFVCYVYLMTLLNQTA